MNRRYTGDKADAKAFVEKAALLRDASKRPRFIK